MKPYYHSIINTTLSASNPLPLKNSEIKNLRQQPSLDERIRDKKVQAFKNRKKTNAKQSKNLVEVSTQQIRSIKDLMPEDQLKRKK